MEVLDANIPCKWKPVKRGEFTLHLVLIHVNNKINWRAVFNCPPVLCKLEKLSHEDNHYFH